MAKVSYRPVLLTLAIGFSGATAAALAGVPAAPLVGASISVSLAALARLSVGIPDLLRNFAFAIIGCSLGSGITKQALSQAVHWPISLLFLGLAVGAIIVAGSWVLARFFNQTPETAVLSTTPGVIAYVLAIAAGGIGDVRTIIVIQNIRLVLVTTLLPFILTHFGFAPGYMQPQIIGSFVGSLLVIVLAFGIGVIVQRWPIPAEYLLAGVLVSGIGHYLDLVSGRPPALLIFCGFTITGSMVGARFSSIPMADLRRLLAASLICFLITGLLAVGFAYPVSVLLEIPFGQVFVAFAPGGVEAMAAIALALGYDPAYVATHHLFRLLLLFLIVPCCVKIVARMARGNHR
ncbi:MAG: AbrB family transcriptional regulator [Desulfofustis sp.]|jgi:membrane AbrB-like protein